MAVCWLMPMSSDLIADQTNVVPNPRPDGVAGRAGPAPDQDSAVPSPTALDGGSALVAILMGTWQGEQYLAPQLDSFLAQQHDSWQLWASDDGSTDSTLTILQDYQSGPMAGRLHVLQGPHQGLAANFLSLACHPDIQADYYAYSDQDDIWEPDKLARALAWLATIPAEIPALYCSRTRLVDSNNHEIGASSLFSRPPCFGNALVQNIGGGNTMVFNQAARRLLVQAGPDVGVLAHDWWTYILVTGCGGRVYYDDYLALRYRQHDSNLMGSNASWAARRQRISLLWQGAFRRWNTDNITALHRMRSHLLPSARHLLDAFDRGRNRALLPRCCWFVRSGLHRQTMLGNLGLWVAALFGKL